MFLGTYLFLVLYSEIEHNGCKLFANIPSGRNSGFKVSLLLYLKELEFENNGLHISIEAPSYVALELRVVVGCFGISFDGTNIWSAIACSLLSY